MKRFYLTVIIIAIISSMSMGCSPTMPTTISPAEAATESPDLDATVEASVAETMAAQENLQATVDAAVAATQSVQQTQAVEDFSVDQMSEEEVIDAVTVDAETATYDVEEIAVTTEDYTSDGELTQEEIEELEALYLETFEEIEYLLYLTSVYSYYYGDLAGETLDLLVAMEDDLWLLVELAEEYSDELLAVLVALENGGEVTEEMIYALEDAAQAWMEEMEAWQGDADSWQAAVLAELQSRTELWLSMDPEEIAQTRVKALAQAKEYAAQVRAVFEDGVISADEMTEIAQLAANAISSLENVGGEQLLSFATHISELTTMLSMGQMPAVLQGLGEFEASLP